MSVPPARLATMSQPPNTELVRCSPTEGCGQLKPRGQMVRWGTSNPLCMACYQRGRRLNQDPAEIRRANLWAKYRITPEQYDALRAGQSFRCAICGIHEADVDLKRVGGRPRRDGQPLFKVPLAVDHDHRTGAIRGLPVPVVQCGAWCVRRRSKAAACGDHLSERRSTTRTATDPRRVGHRNPAPRADRARLLRLPARRVTRQPRPGRLQQPRYLRHNPRQRPRAHQLR
jgi:hypothetical protein